MREGRKWTAQEETAILQSEHDPVIQIFVFRGEEYLGWDCYSKPEITIGSAEGVDLVLEDSEVRDIHAIVYLEQGRIMATYGMDEDRGGETPGPVVIRALDLLRIGPYTLKIKQLGKKVPGIFPCNAGYYETATGPVRECPPEDGHAAGDTAEGSQAGDADNGSGIPMAAGPGETGPGESARNGLCGDTEEVEVVHQGEGPDPAPRYDLTFSGKIKEGTTSEQVEDRLKPLFGKNPACLDKLFSGRKVLLKCNAEYKAVIRLRDLFEQAGALCTIEPRIGSADISTESRRPFAQEEAPCTACVQEAGAFDASGSCPGNEPVQEASAEEKGRTPEIRDGFRRRPVCIDDDDDDEDEEEPDARFSLKERIRDCAVQAPTWMQGKKETLLEVVKTKNGIVFDVEFLKAGDRYN
ncbi:hypothetical protein EG829_11640, partial [bacterium]|nr:hypothetical protein [bacterium]